MIWVIGGTSDANAIVQELFKNNHKEVLVSTTTSYGSLLAKKDEVKVVQKALTYDEMIQLIQQNHVKQVIDASHPFAIEVSLNAIKACLQTEIKYIRYEREILKFKSVRYFKTYNEIVNELNKTEGNILLTIGSKNVHLFKNITERIIARVLPVVKSIQQCEKANLKSNQILAMKGRVSQQTNEALMKEYDIKYLVTKDSGEAGGLEEKISAAQKLGVSVLILERPTLNYPIVYNSISEIMNCLN